MLVVARRGWPQGRGKATRARGVPVRAKSEFESRPRPEGHGGAQRIRR
jgi:hypothetical protein